MLGISHSCSLKSCPNGFFPRYKAQILSLERGSSCVFIQAILYNFLKKHNSIQKVCSHENFLLQLHVQGEVVCSFHCYAELAGFILQPRSLWSTTQPEGYALHSAQPKGQAVHATWHSLKAMLIVQHGTAHHIPVLTQVNCCVDH